MEITRVKYTFIERVSPTQPLAKCSVVLDDCLMLNGIKIFDGAKGKYLVLPERKENSKKGKDSTEDRKGDEIYHPVDKAFFDAFSKVVVEGYELCQSKGGSSYRPK